MRSRLTALAVCLWAAGLAGGFAAWMEYDTTPGASAKVHGTIQESETARFRLVMFAHPHCPCTRAGLEELERIAGDFPQTETTVFFCKPTDAIGPEWDAAKSPADFVQVQSKWDDGCLEAKRCGATTSGHLLLFHPDGTLVFSGGITRARGYVGESIGSQAIRLRLQGETRELQHTAVFGCPLHDSQNSDS